MISDSLILAVFVLVNCVIDYFVFRQVAIMSKAYGDLQNRVSHIEGILTKLLSVLGDELGKHGQYVVEGVAGALSLISKEHGVGQTAAVQELGGVANLLAPFLNTSGGNNKGGFL